MIKTLITEFPLSDFPKERTITEEKIRKYTYTKEEVDVLISNAVKEAVEEAVRMVEVMHYGLFPAVLMIGLICILCRNVVLETAKKIIRTLFIRTGLLS